MVLFENLYDWIESIFMYNKYEAAEKNQLYRVKQHIKYKNDPFMQSYKDWVLVCACDRGYLEMVKYIISVGADVHDDRALQYAIYKQHFEIIECLVDNGADVPHGLIVASQNPNNVSLIKYFISKGATNLNNSLTYASFYGHLDNVKYLIDAGADVQYNHSPICFAASLGHIEVSEYLISKGANIHSNDDYALCCANSIKACEYLLDHHDFKITSDILSNVLITFQCFKYLVVERGANIYADNHKVLYKVLRNDTISQDRVGIISFILEYYTLPQLIKFYNNCESYYNKTYPITAEHYIPIFKRNIEPHIRKLLRKKIKTLLYLIIVNRTLMDLYTEVKFRPGNSGFLESFNSFSEESSKLAQCYK